MDLRPAPALRCQADLEALWRRLVPPRGFVRGSTWLLHVDAAGRPSPRITEIQDADEPPGPEQLASLATMLAHVAADEPGGRWAFLRSRPGRGGPTAADRAWAEGLLAACLAAGVPTDVVHVATDDRLVPLPLDDLALPA